MLATVAGWGWGEKMQHIQERGNATEPKAGTVLIHGAARIGLKNRMLKEISGKDKYREAAGGCGIAGGWGKNRVTAHERGGPWGEARIAQLCEFSKNL